MFWSVLNASLLSGICSLQLPDRSHYDCARISTLKYCLACLSKTTIKTLKQYVKFVQTFFISHLAALRPTLGHWKENSFTYPMLIKTLFQVQPVGHQEPLSDVESQSLTECISGIQAEDLPITEIPGLSRAMMLIWQRWLFGEVILWVKFFSFAMLILQHDVISWNVSVTSSTLKAFMKF